MFAPRDLPDGNPFNDVSELLRIINVIVTSTALWLTFPWDLSVCLAYTIYAMSGLALSTSGLFARYEQVAWNDDLAPNLSCTNVADDVPPDLETGDLINLDETGDVIWQNFTFTVPVIIQTCNNTLCYYLKGNN